MHVYLRITNAQILNMHVSMDSTHADTVGIHRHSDTSCMCIHAQQKHNICICVYFLSFDIEILHLRVST